MVADVSGEEVEEYLLANKLVQENDAEPAVPINAPCATEQHESPVRMRL
jgi:monothiol glutaredoxin